MTSRHFSKNGLEPKLSTTIADFKCDSSVDDSVKAAVRAVFSLNDHHNTAQATAVMNLKDSEMEVVKISGGITNQLRRVILQPNAPTAHPIPGSVLVRIFGGDSVIDREVENPMFMAVSGYLGKPGYYGRFKNGRLEGWLDGYRPLKIQPMEMGDHVQKIARRMATLHKMPNDIYPAAPAPKLWPQIWEWYNTATTEKVASAIAEEPGNSLQTPHGRELYTKLNLSSEEVKNTLKRLRSEMPTNAPLAFCHNDVLAGNVMLHEESGDICLIDFEYGSTNYRGFDIANHFNEYAGGSDNGYPDYNQFPSPEKQRMFCQAYLEELNDRPPTDVEITALVDEATVFVKINCWFWGLWAVVQAADEGTAEFPYMTYGFNRISRFYDVDTASK